MHSRSIKSSRRYITIRIKEVDFDLRSISDKLEELKSRYARFIEEGKVSDLTDLQKLEMEQLKKRCYSLSNKLTDTYKEYFHLIKIAHRNYSIDYVADYNLNVLYLDVDFIVGDDNVIPLYKIVGPDELNFKYLPLSTKEYITIMKSVMVVNNEEITHGNH
jgi:hypothetical protein